MKQRSENIEGIEMMFDNGIGMRFNPADGNLIAFKPDLEVTMTANGHVITNDAMSKPGRYFLMQIDEKMAAKKLDFVNNHSSDEIDEVTAFYDEGHMRVMQKILDYSKISVDGKTSILFRAAK